MAQTDFPCFDFTKYENEYFGINAYGIHYIMPKSYAAQLVEFTKSNNLSFADAKKWYDQLSEQDRKNIVRFDMNENKYL